MSERKRSGRFAVLSQYFYDCNEEDCPNISRIWGRLKMKKEYLLKQYVAEIHTDLQFVLSCYDQW